MLNIYDISNETKQIFIEMCNDFYNSKAVMHTIPVKNMEDTANEAMAKNPMIRCLILENDDDVVGFSIISFTYSNEAGGLTAWLEELYIKEEYRLKGLGKEYFEWVFNTYNSTVKRYRLELSKDNIRVYDLYKSLGFEELPYIQMIIEKN